MFCFFVDYYFCHPLNYDVRLAVQGKKKKKHTQQDFAHREGSPTEPRLFWGAIKGTLSGESRMKCQVQVCGKRERRHLTTKEGKRCFVESEKWLLWGDEESKKKKKKEKRNGQNLQTSNRPHILFSPPPNAHTFTPPGVTRASLFSPSFLLRVKLQRAVRPKEPLCRGCRWVLLLLLVVIRRHNT